MSNSFTVTNLILSLIVVIAAVGLVAWLIWAFQQVVKFLSDDVSFTPLDKD